MFPSHNIMLISVCKHGIKTHVLMAWYVLDILCTIWICFLHIIVMVHALLAAVERDARVIPTLRDPLLLSFLIKPLHSNVSSLQQVHIRYN